MPIDYSKWDNFDDSDEDEPHKPAPKPVKELAKEAAKPVVAPAKQESGGSSWNANSWHFEESKYDKWGEQRLRELLAGGKQQAVVIEHSDLEFHFKFSLTVSKLEGEAWTHVRKGKKVTGYNYEMSLGWAGSVSGGSTMQECYGTVQHELTVDDDDPSTDFTCSQHFPFRDELKKAVLGFVAKQCRRFVDELAQKGTGSKDGWRPAEPNVQVGQYQKYTDGVDGTAKSAEVAAKLGKTGDGHKPKSLHTDVKTT